MSYEFYVPTRTMFGAGVLNNLHMKNMPGKKAMVVISNGKSMKETGTLDCVLIELEQAGVDVVVYDKAQDFVDMLVQLQKDCGVSTLKMSDFGIQKDEFDTLARNARETMGGLFGADPKELSHEECVTIYEKSYR